MLEVEEVRYLPNEAGGEIRSKLTSGSQELSTNWALGSDNAEELNAMLDQLRVNVQELVFTPASGTAEVQVQLEFAGRVYITRLPVDENDRATQDLVQQFVKAAGQRSVRNVQAALNDGQTQTPQPAYEEEHSQTSPEGQRIY